MIEKQERVGLRVAQRLWASDAIGNGPTIGKLGISRSVATEMWRDHDDGD